MKKLLMIILVLTLPAFGAAVKDPDIRKSLVSCDGTEKIVPSAKVTQEEIDNAKVDLQAALNLWQKRPCVKGRSWIDLNAALAKPTSSSVASSSSSSKTSSVSSSASSSIQTVGVLTVVAATASTQTSPNVPMNAVDGNSSTRWESALKTDPSWITLDFGSNKTLMGIAIDWEDSNADSYTIDGSTNNSTWTPITSFSNGKFGARTDVLVLQGTYRYLRITGTKRPAISEWGYSIYEIRVSGLGGAATSSSSASSAAPVAPVSVTITLNRPTMRENGDALAPDEILGYQVRKSTGENLVMIAASPVDPISYVMKVAAGDVDLLQVATVDKSLASSSYVNISVSN